MLLFSKPDILVDTYEVISVVVWSKVLAVRIKRITNANDHGNDMHRQTI